MAEPDRRPVEHHELIFGFSALATAVVIGFGLLAAATWADDHEWPWYLVIVGTGLPFVAALALPRPVSTGPLLVVIGALVLWVYGAGIAVDLADSNDTFGLAPVAVGVFGVVVVGFFGVLFLPREGSAHGGLTDAAMRHAFGTAFLLGYFAIAFAAIFHKEWDHSKLGDDLINEATTLLGVVVAFYFASTGTVEYLKHRERQMTIRAGRDPDGGTGGGGGTPPA
jgi:hypothetical protein